MTKYILKSRHETKKLAEDIARKFCFKRGKSGRALVFALNGELGSGKTTFIQGFLKKLGVRSRVTSPTFIIFKPYKIVKNKYYKNAYHADFYRIKNSKELKAIGFSELFNNPSNIILIEWAGKVKKIIPQKSKWLTFSHGASENERIVNLS